MIRSGAGGKEIILGHTLLCDVGGVDAEECGGGNSGCVTVSLDCLVLTWLHQKGGAGISRLPLLVGGALLNLSIYLHECINHIHG